MARVTSGDYEVKYKCAQCGALDSNKYWGHEQPIPVLNCWKCKAGFKVLDVSQQFSQGLGMFPIK